MKSWHYNISRIVKSPEFKSALISCLNELEGPRDHSILLSMLKNYFSLRNKGFGTNWINLPTSKVTLCVTQRGVYFCPEVGYPETSLPKLLDLNDVLFKGIGKRDWVLTFTDTKPPSKEKLLCHQKMQ